MYSKTSELFEFNKMMFVYVVTILVVCLWGYRQFTLGKLELRYHWIVIPLTLFLGANVISTIFSIDVHTSIFGYYGRFNGGLLSIIAYLLLFFIFIQISDRRHVITCLRLSFATAVLVVLWGIPGRYGSDLSCFIFTGKITNACWTAQFKPAERMFSTLGQPNWLGAYLAANFFFGLYFLVIRNAFNNRSTLLLTSALLLIFSGILFTRSRSALLAVAISLVVFGLYYLYLKRATFKNSLLHLAILGALLFVPLVIFQSGIAKVDDILSLKFLYGQKSQQVVLQTQDEQNQIVPSESTGSGPESTATAARVQTTPAGPIVITDSFDIRKIVWEGALKLGQQHPLVGTGVETFAYAYYMVRPQAHNATSEWDFLYNKAHNEFLNYVANTGYSGLIAYLGMILATYWILHRAIVKKGVRMDQRLLFLSLLAGYTTIHITNFFGFSISIMQILFYLIPGFAIVYSITDGLPAWTLKLPSHRYYIFAGRGAMVLLMVLGIIYLSRYYLADMTYAAADLQARSGNYQTAYEEFQRALQYRYEHVYEDKLSNVLSNLAFIAAYQDKPDLTKELIQLSDAYNQKSILASPSNVLYRKTTSKNKYLHYQISLDPKYLDEAIEAIEQAKKLSPTDPRLFYTQALFYSLSYDEVNGTSPEDRQRREDYKQRALTEAGLVVAMKPDYKEGIILYADLLKKFGEQDKAIAVLKDYLNTYNPADGDILNKMKEIQDVQGMNDAERESTVF
jgi:O-antigen ligase